MTNPADNIYTQIFVIRWQKLQTTTKYNAPDNTAKQTVISFSVQTTNSQRTSVKINKKHHKNTPQTEKDSLRKCNDF